jgi:hypothetical protein
VAQRICDEPGCERKHEARGLCKTHWKRKHGKRTKYQRTCDWCHVKYLSDRPTGRFCSDVCKGATYHDARPGSRALVGPVEPDRCMLPERHPAMRAYVKPRLWIAGTCAWCDSSFVDRQSAARYCSRYCSVRAGRHRRRAREHNTPNNWRWSDFMRLVMRFDHRCAYCLAVVDQLDPDHVIPLSVGGADSISNLLPSCRACNCDKRDLPLHEWNADRARRGLPPRRTELPNDPRYRHLTHVLLISPAA